MDNICLWCRKKPKRDGHTFCSSACSRGAASNAPELIVIPRNHVMFNNGIALITVHSQADANDIDIRSGSLLPRRVEE